MVSPSCFVHTNIVVLPAPVETAGIDALLLNTRASPTGAASANVLPPVPSCLNTRTIVLIESVLPGMPVGNVIVALPLRVYLFTLHDDDTVRLVPVLVNAAASSTKLLMTLPPNATAPLKVPVVARRVLGVVAPTVPLILIDAVPVRLVTTPDAGVPRIAPLPNVVMPVIDVLPDTVRFVPTVARPDRVARPVEVNATFAVIVLA